MKIHLSAEVESSLVAGKPVLALESTIITHGMPHPDNVEFALRAEFICRQQGVVPATMSIFLYRVVRDVKLYILGSILFMVF